MRRQFARPVIGLLIATLLATNGHFAPRVAAAGADPIRYTYDANGRLSAVIDPAAGSAAYTYDAAGNITSITRRANTAVDIAANRTAGKAAEGVLSQTFGGGPKSFIINNARRDVDNFINGVAQEAKVGYTSLTTFIKQQIAKDAALLADPTSGVTSVEWHFFSSATGQGGTAPLIQALRDAGIKIIYHP